MKRIIFLALLTSVLTACANHQDVRPSLDGMHHVVLSSIDGSDGMREALKQAKHYCNEDKQKMFVVSENVKYQGPMLEEDYQKQRLYSKVAEGLGTTLWILGNGKVDDAGGILGLGAAGYKESLGQPYTINVIFSCH